MKSILLFSALFFLSCKVQQPTVVFCKVLSLASDIPTMKGYKYYIECSNKLDSIYVPAKIYTIGQYYPFLNR